ncbi:MAG: GNAT family protein [Candidatus Nanopelagicales bacterium]
MSIPADPRADDVVWPQAQWPPPHELIGEHVTLTQFVAADAPELYSALDHDACWDHIAGRPSTAEEYAATLAQAPQSGRWPWVVRRADVVVGTTSYLDVSLPNARVEIGYTAYTPAVWATEINPECKLLLIGWAVDHGFGRVQLKTDIRNGRSQAAIAGLGATYEGVLRRYQRRADGTVRDTVMYSVTAQEWPGVRERLRARLAR